MQDQQYKVGQFSDVYGWPEAERLWRWLNNLERVQLMIGATNVEKPAVQGLAILVEAEFPMLFGSENTLTEKQRRRVKQMTGHMIRQIMERHGYVLESHAHKIRTGGPFSQGTRYRRRGN